MRKILGFALHIIPFARPAQQMAGPIHSAGQALTHNRTARRVAAVSAVGFAMSLAVGFFVADHGGGMRLAHAAVGLVNVWWTFVLVFSFWRRLEAGGTEFWTVVYFFGVQLAVAAAVGIELWAWAH